MITTRRRAKAVPSRPRDRCPGSGRRPIAALALAVSLVGAPDRIAVAQPADGPASNGSASRGAAAEGPWVPGHASAARAHLAEARAEFLEAWSKIEAGGPELAAGDSERLRAYPLYPYLEAARIAAALARAEGARTPADAEAEAEAFLARHRGEPVARMLHR